MSELHRLPRSLNFTVFLLPVIIWQTELENGGVEHSSEIARLDSFPPCRSVPLLSARVRQYFQSSRTSPDFQHFDLCIVTAINWAFLLGRGGAGSWKRRSARGARGLAFQIWLPSSAYNKIQLRMASKGFKTVDLVRLAALLHAYDQEAPARRLVRDFNRQNRLNVNYLAPAKICQMAQKIENRLKCVQNRAENALGRQEEGSWAFGEQRLFSAILPYFCDTFGLQIEEATLSDVRPLSTILVGKRAESLLFEIKHMLSLSGPSKSAWTPRDLQALSAILGSPRYQQLSEGNMKWKQAAFELFVGNGLTVFHPARDCRERWINHLDPVVLKEAWQPCEDLELFLKIQRLGCRWALISKSMRRARTEHMIKNRVNALKRRYIARPSAKLRNSHVAAIVAALQAAIAQEAGGDREEELSADKQPADLKEASPAELEVSVQEASLPLDILDVITPRERYAFAWEPVEEDWEYDEGRAESSCELFGVPCSSPDFGTLFSYFH